MLGGPKCLILGEQHYFPKIWGARPLSPPPGYDNGKNSILPRWRYCIGKNRCRSKQFFGGAKDILPGFCQICPENFFVQTFPRNFLQLLVHYIFLNNVDIHTSLFRWQINSTVMKVYKKIYKLIKLNLVKGPQLGLRLGGRQNTIQRA